MTESSIQFSNKNSTVKKKKKLLIAIVLQTNKRMNAYKKKSDKF